MKNLCFIALSLTGICSLTINANEFPTCKSDLTKQMQRFEKTDFTVPRKIPTGNLREFALKMEILCPWQIEADFNGDKQKDWVGIIKRNERYELVSYMSALRKYNVQVLHSYEFFPEQTYLKITKKKVTKTKAQIGKRFNYDLAEITLNETSRIYSLNNNKYTVIHQYEDVTVLDSQSSNKTHDSEDID